MADEQPEPVQANEKLEAPPSEGGKAVGAAAEVAKAPKAAGEDDAIRSVYVARAAASAGAPATDFASMATVEEGGALRGAYLTHLFEAKTEAIGAGEPSGEDTLRSVYVARAVASAGAALEKAKPARRKASIVSRKRAKLAAPARAKASGQSRGRGKRRRR
jgi:hypothetical protein